MRYPGGKFRLYQQIINLMPPHRVYIETHLGGGAVLRNKTAAVFNIGIDRDLSVVCSFKGVFGKNYKIICSEAESFLKAYRFKGDELVYADPPYWPSSRKSKKSPYRYDYTEQQHLELLKILLTLPCQVMISGYRSEAYSKILAGWHQYSLIGTSHTGKREEIIWTNFETSVLHDTRFIGKTFRDRQTIRRKRERWKERFLKQPPCFQQAVLHDLNTAFQQNLNLKSNVCLSN